MSIPAIVASETIQERSAGGLLGMAERYPNAQIVAVSNSQPQRIDVPF
jgi:hypothetical protein